MKRALVFVLIMGLAACGLFSKTPMALRSAAYGAALKECEDKSQTASEYVGCCERAATSNHRPLSDCEDGGAR